MLRRSVLPPLLSFLLLVGACSAARLPDFQPQAIDQYPQRAERNGLVVAAHALTDEDQVERYFGTDLVDDGILPVLVVAANRGSDSSFIVLSDSIQLARPTAKATGDDVASTTASQAVGYTGLATALVVPVVAIALIPTAAAMLSSAREQSYSFLTKQFHSQTVSPGEQVSGFMYFKLKDGSLPAPGTVVRVRVLRPGVGQAQLLEIPLRVSRR